MKLQTVVDSDGTVQQYPDMYGDVTTDLAAHADRVQQIIIDRTQQIKSNYLVIGTLLNKFKEEELYLAKGFSTFKAWCDSPELTDMTYRTAVRLVQIVTEALPLFEKHDSMALAQTIGISKMADLLPILNDADGEAKFIEAAYKVQDLTSRDAKEEIKNIRGISSSSIDTIMPTVFTARVQRGENTHRLRVTANDGVDFFDMGTLTVRTKDFARWEERFGRFLQYEN